MYYILCKCNTNVCNIVQVKVFILSRDRCGAGRHGSIEAGKRGSFEVVRLLGFEDWNIGTWNLEPETRNKKHDCRIPSAIVFRISSIEYSVEYIGVEPMTS
jgi:hypothetical protein